MKIPAERGGLSSLGTRERESTNRSASFVSSCKLARGRYKKLAALLRARAGRGTGALHQSLRGSWHRSNGTGPSSGIAATPSVIAAATLASSTLSVYDRVAPTTLVRQKVFANQPQIMADV